ALAPIRAPRVAQVELRLPMRILEYQEEHALAVAVRSVDGARQATAVRPRLLLAAPLGGPRPRQMPRIPGDQQLVAAVVVGVDDAPATLVDPFPEIGAFAGARGGRERTQTQSGDDGGSFH